MEAEAVSDRAAECPVNACPAFLYSYGVHRCLHGRQSRSRGFCRDRSDVHQHLAFRRDTVGCIGGFQCAGGPPHRCRRVQTGEGCPEAGFGGNIGKNYAEIRSLGVSPGDFGIYKDIYAYEGNTLGNHFGSANIFWEGHAPGLFFGYQTAGIVQVEDLPANGGSYNVTQDLNNGVPQAGDIKFVDQNGDGIINTDDRVVIGDPNPKFTYGFQTKFTWKGLSISAQFNGVYGNELLNTNLRYQAIPNRAGGNIRTESWQQAWTPENKSNAYPRVDYTIPAGVFDMYVEDASFLRCSDITISYSIPAKAVRKIGFNSINVFASVKNAFIITKYSGYDPEVNTFAFDGLRPGIDMSSFPMPRSYILGLNVSF